jgi:CDP-diacylglycerol---glycerol-3-phosphate 3-phosphatidyltransferase
VLDGKFRSSVEKVTMPIGRGLVAAGFSADVLTFSGLIFAVATAWAIGQGYHLLSVVLLTLTGFHDMFDGPVAKLSQRASQRGSFFDSVVDRVSDALLMGGCAYYLESRGHGHMVLLPFAILTTTFLISYQRSKAESLGLSAKGGMMERAERMIVLGVGLLANVVFLPVLWALLVLTLATALGRFVRVWKVADAPPSARESRSL